MSRTTPGVAVVSGLSSDAHTWNLVYLQLLLEESGYRVVNLGACVPDAELAARCRRARPELIALGSVNGHAGQDGPRAVAAIRAQPGLVTVPVVIGGLLDTV
ncbi:cobalamin-dependent protein, partial [Streptomyces hyaluromycini]